MAAVTSVDSRELLPSVGGYVELIIRYTKAAQNDTHDLPAKVASVVSVYARDDASGVVDVVTVSTFNGLQRLTFTGMNTGSGSARILCVLKNVLVPGSNGV